MILNKAIDIIIIYCSSYAKLRKGNLVMELEQFDEILKSQRQFFINKIKEEIETDHVNWVNEDSYPEFSLLSEEFFEQKWYESYHEYYIREALITPIISKLLSPENMPDLIVEWPRSKEIMKGHNNLEFELKNPVEFYIDDDNRGRLGFRYSKINRRFTDDINHVFFDDDSVFLLEKLYILSFSGNAPCYGELNIQGMSFEEFFDMYFTHEMYEMFQKEVSDSVNEAKSLIAIKTIPELSPKYLASYRYEVEKRIINADVSCYTVYGRHLSQDEINEFTNLPTDSENLYRQNYLGLSSDQLFKVLTGKGEFAKCFLTSEYLFDSIKNNNLIDFTSVISGYLKCVELLLSIIMTSFYNWDYSSKVLGFMVKRLGIQKNWSNCIFINSSDSLKEVFIKCVECYLKECRNAHFHKHLVLDWDEVETIRNNTIFLCKLMLISLKWNGDINTVFGFPNDRFDRMCAFVKENPHHPLLFKKTEESECQEVFAEKRKYWNYTCDGYFEDMDLLFREIEGGEVFTINRNILPEEVYYDIDGIDGTERIRLY